MPVEGEIQHALAVVEGVVGIDLACVFVDVRNFQSRRVRYDGRVGIDIVIVAGGGAAFVFTASV